MVSGRGYARQTAGIWNNYFTNAHKRRQLKGDMRRSADQALSWTRPMNHIQALEERVAELEHRLADLAQRQTKGSAECYHRLEIQRSPINSGLKLVPAAHRETSNADSRDLVKPDGEPPNV